MSEPKKKTKLVAICMTEEDHRVIKIEAAKRGITMKVLIMTAVGEYLER